MTLAVEICDVYKAFGSFEALRGVDIGISQGEFFGLLGPNGAGKSTLINLLAGLLTPTRGQLSVLGHDVVQNYRQARRVLGVVPQELVFDPFFSVREMLRFQSGYFGLGRSNYAWIDQVIESLGLSAQINTNMRRLSGGMKRRVLIAQALVHKPPVIVLDEPTAGVDVELRQMLWGFIRELNQEGHTIILTTHYLEEAESLCSRIAMLKQGKVVAMDSTCNLLNRISGKSLRVKVAEAPLPDSLQSISRGYEKGWLTLGLAETSRLAWVLAELQNANMVVEDVQLIETDLEDVFVEVLAQ